MLFPRFRSPLSVLALSAFSTLALVACGDSKDSACDANGCWDSAGGYTYADGSYLAPDGGYYPATGGYYSPSGEFFPDGNPDGSVPGAPVANPTGGGSSTGGGASTPDNQPTTTTRTEIVCTSSCEDKPRESESCEDAKAWGFCSQPWFTDGNYCQKTCGSCDGSEEVCKEVVVEVPVGTGGSSSTGGSSGTGGTTSGSGGGTTRPPGNGSVTPLPSSAPTGKSTRYWDCCMAHCSWSGNVESSPYASNPAKVCDKSNNPSSESARSACDGGGGYTCWSMAPWAVSDTLAYGYAASHGSGQCGMCYQLDFTGEADGSAGTVKGKTMIVQLANIGYDVTPGQLDLLIPGGGVGAFNACSDQWGTSDLGEQYGGFLAACGGDVGCLKKKCNSVFSGKPDLLNGCLFHAEWMGGADNPKFRYQEVECPSALKQTSGMN